MFVWLCAYAIEYVGKYFDPNTNVDKKVQRTYQDKRKKEEKTCVRKYFKEKMKIKRKLHN